MDSILSIRDLSIRIKDRTLFQNVSFDVDAAEVVLLSGPNGCGKSSLLKSILRLESDGKQISGQIVERSFGDVFSLSGSDLQTYRSKVAYVQQKDEYSEMGNIQVRDIISESGAAHSGRALSYAEVNDLIDEWIPRRSDNSRVFDAKARPARFSGGEQRLLSVLSVIATRPRAELLIIDEPLNNLDFVNARNISNLRRRTRLGMGTCQGELCACRAAGLVAGANGCVRRSVEDLASFMNERWKGMYPICWGDTLRESEYSQWIYSGVCGLEGGECETNKAE